MAPAPIKKVSEPTANTQSVSRIGSGMQRTSVLLIALAFISGIAGGFIGGRINTNRITSLDSTATQQKIASSQSELISGIAKDVSPSVVSINVESTVQTDNVFFGPSESVSQGAGTGFIVSSDGVVVTNKHVIPDNVTKVSITTNEGESYDNVDVIARDPRSNVDLAFLKINGVKDLKPVKLGDSSQMVVGDSVIAIGYALGEFQNTVTGNSGGPLLNMSGEVIGINTAVAGNAENIGFAIPINDVKPQITSILEKGKLEVPYLGVRYVMLTEAIQQRFGLALSSGAWLKAGNEAQAVVNGSPADKAGLKEGDIIVKVNGEAITIEKPLASVLSKYAVGDELEIVYNRDGKEQSTKATLEVAPSTN